MIDETIMHHAAVTSLAKRLTAIADEMVVPFPLASEGEKAIGAKRSYGWSLPEKANEEFHRLASEILGKYGWSDKFSQKYLLKRVMEILTEAVKLQSISSVEGSFRQLVEDYEQFDHAYLVIIPLRGFSIGVPSIRLGRVLLRQYEGNIFEDVAMRTRSVLMRKTHYTEKEKVAIGDDLHKNYVSKLMGKVCSEITVPGESERALEIASKETRFALDLVRYSLLFIYAEKMREGEIPRTVGIMGEVWNEAKHSLCIRKDDEHFAMSQRATSHPLLISEDTVEMMTEIGVFKLSVMYRKEKPTEFEDILLRAVRWLASAQIQVEMQNAFLNLATSVETVFQVSPGERIASSISEGVALVLGDSFEERKQTEHPPAGSRWVRQSAESPTVRGDKAGRAFSSHRPDNLAGVMVARSISIPRDPTITPTY